MVLARIRFRAQPHKRPEIVSAVDETLARMRHAAGCGRARLYVDSDDPFVFTVISEWQAAEDVHAFVGSKDFRLFRGIQMLLRGEPLLIVDDVLVRVTRLIR